jgi:hypothetical protein
VKANFVSDRLCMATSRSCSGADAFLGLRRLLSMDLKDKMGARSLILVPRSLEAGRQPLVVSRAASSSRPSRISAYEALSSRRELVQHFVHSQRIQWLSVV